MTMVASKHNCRHEHGSGTTIKRIFGSESSETHATAEIEDYIIINLPYLAQSDCTEQYLLEDQGSKNQTSQWPLSVFKFLVPS